MVHSWRIKRLLWLSLPLVLLLALLSREVPLVSDSRASAQLGSTVWAWGLNGDGQLGDGTTIRRPSPVQVSGLVDAQAIAGGELHSLALADDRAWAWGANSFGQLGRGGDRLTAGQGFLCLAGCNAISAGDFHSLALTTDGTAWAWGGTPRASSETAPRRGVDSLFW